MQRVTGIGGIYIKARDAERLREWYRKHLGLPIADWGGVSFDGREARTPPTSSRARRRS
jgi:hypothetical protein